MGTIITIQQQEQQNTASTTTTSIRSMSIYPYKHRQCLLLKPTQPKYPPTGDSEISSIQNAFLSHLCQRYSSEEQFHLHPTTEEAEDEHHSNILPRSQCPRQALQGGCPA